MRKKAAKQFETEWIFSGFSDEPGFAVRNMFSCRASYLDGKLVLILAESKDDENWNGLLVATDREHHASLIAQFPELISHSILGKWLYLSAKKEEFEESAESLARLVYRRDPRIGVFPKPKRKSKTRGKK